MPLGYSISETAERLGVTRKTLSEIVNARAAISSEMALRIGFATHTTPESWLGMQMHYDLWHTKQRKTAKALRRVIRPLRKKAA